MPLAPTTTGQLRTQADQSLLTAELELLDTNIALWRELTDEAFERHFRQRYFGNEPIFRQQAIERLTGLRANRLQTTSVDAATPDANGSSCPPEAAVNVKVVSSDIHILMLPSRRLPWPSLLLSISAHGLILLLLLSIRLPQRNSRMIDFDTETITYYKMSESFPNVAPKRLNESSQSRSELKPPADFQTHQEIRIRPMDSEQSEIVIEQPNVRQVSTLPKLQLPNILLQTTKMDPGRAPLVVSADVLTHLAMDVQQPQPLGNLSQNSMQSVTTRQQPALPLPQIAAPAEPASESLTVSQIGGQFTRLQQRAALLPFAAPPVDDSPAGFQITTMPAQGPGMLVFSGSPTVPKGEIAVPKVSSKGRLTGSSMQPSKPVLPQGVEELSRAEVFIPPVSINSQTPQTVIGAGTATVQAPLPRLPESPKPITPTRGPSLLDFLPSRIPSSKPLLGRHAEVGSGESPLRDYESRGGPVYTAAINAPNFTSKRGSWIFRFAELSADGPVPSPTTPVASLTAPSAIIKVDPKYAPEVVREKLEGVVILFAVLRKDGTIDGESVRVIRKVDSRLDLSAREALLNWKFKPSERNGIAVDIQMEVSIPFYFRRDGL
jgi:TonB family protein